MEINIGKAVKLLFGSKSATPHQCQSIGIHTAIQNQNDIEDDINFP